MRAYLPRWPLAVTCPNSMLPAPASAGDATHDTHRDSSSGSTSWVAPTPDSPPAVPDAAPESFVLPVPPAGAPIGGGTNLHPYR